MAETHAWPGSPNRALNFSRGCPTSSRGLRSKDMLDGRIHEGDAVLGAGHQNAVGDRLQDGLGTTGFLLLISQHQAKALGLVPDQFVQTGIVDGHGHLVGDGLDEGKAFAREVGFGPREDHQHADHVVGHHQGRDHRAAMLARGSSCRHPAWVLPQVIDEGCLTVLDHPAGQPFADAQGEARVARPSCGPRHTRIRRDSGGGCHPD